MKTKEPKNTGPPIEENESPKKQQKQLFKSKKETPAQAAKKFESELPDVAKRNNIRVSSPYGYYPEDVNKIITDMESELKMLQKENNHLNGQLTDYKGRLNDAQTELTKLKMQMTLMEIPDASAEENFAMLSRISTITGNNEEQISNKVIKSPKKNNITIIQSPAKKAEPANNEPKKKAPAVISLNLNKKG